MQNYGRNFLNSVPQKVKILIVDGYPNSASLLARSLSRVDARVEVVTATCAQQALECAKNDTVDILITDMDIPEMTGLELIARLPERSAGSPAVSFLITTSHAMELKNKARELNVRKVFHKPVRPERIIAAIRRVLEEMQEELP